MSISIHAPTWGATSFLAQLALFSRDFNPRTHVGCDLLMHFGRWALVNISIHAPTWGATNAKDLNVTVAINFNPRTHVGCDVRTLNSISFVCQFQSTHPRGVRLGILLWCSSLKDFNPRTHVGCDLRYQLWCRKLYKFQSTHPRGVRPKSFDKIVAA